MTINDQVSETISEESMPEVTDSSGPEDNEDSDPQIIEDSESEEIQTAETTQEEQDESDKTRWQEGDEIDLVRVRFPGNSKSFPFLVGKRHFSYGQKVVAMSDRGMDVGYINSFPYTVKFKKTMLPIRSISKVATNDDILAMQGDIDKQRAAEVIAADLIDNLGLDMQITHVEIIQFGKKMVFYFTAPARVDFRDLVKRLVGELKMRIELRQISVRDRAAALGSIGACGLATCCSTFLKNYGNVSIKMAKNQNLALIPSKINGVCGQIKCCIKYEDDVYSDKRKLLPREGNFIHAANGDKGKVTKLHILVEQFDMITEKGQIRRYAKSQFHEGKVLGREYKFPTSFSHVVNETSNVIGLEEVQAEMAEDFNKGLSEEEVSLRNVEKLSIPTEEAVTTAPTNEDNSSEETSSETSESENKESVEKKNPRRRNRNRNRNKNRNKTPAS